MIKFGPSGNCELFYDKGHKHTVEAAKFVKEFGLDSYEYSFGRGVNMTEPTARLIGDAFEKEGIEISVHAPYYINYANPDDEMAKNSFGYLISSAKALKCLKGKRVVFHAATQGKLSRQAAVDLTIERLKILTDLIYEYELNDLTFCPETMGKIAQIGTIEEIVEFCKIDNCFTPCVDFGHVNAREFGSLKTEDDYRSRLEYMISELGYERMKHFHIHFSKIMYGAKGEIKHLTFEDDKYGPEFEPLAYALKKLKLEPYIISESAGTQAEDAKTMKDIFNSVDI